MSFTKTKLAKAVAIAITGSTLSVGAISDASAASTTMYNLFHSQGSTPCAPCAVGETDGWVWGGVADSTPTGTDTIETSSPTINGSAGAGWVGTSAANKTPFGYKGGGTLNWAVELKGGNGGIAQISNADSIAHYGVSADIDTAKGAWSDNAINGASGWRHDLDFGLFKSDKTGLVTLHAVAVNGAGGTPNIGFTIFDGMDTSTGSYNHHGAWNGLNNTQTGAPTATAPNPAYNPALPVSSSNPLTIPGSVPGGGRNLPVSSIVAYSIGGATPSNLNDISFNAVAGRVYTIAVGGYRNGDWGTTTDGYALTVSQVPVPGAVWLFGSAMAGLVGFGRRNKIAA